MTREDIIRLAKEAGMAEPTEFLYNNYWTAGQSELERFAALVAKVERVAALVAAAEREACAEICDEYAQARYEYAQARYAADAIRARGESK